MEYYLTKLTIEIEVPGPDRHTYYQKVKVKQLVKASSKDNAREAVKKAAMLEYPEGKIHEIRVNDTLIGE